MNLRLFRASLGLIGIEYSQFLSDRIFNSIGILYTDYSLAHAQQDHPKDVVSFKSYIKYLDVIINGESEEKSKYAFILLDADQNGFIELNDIQAMLNGICVLWNFLTGA